MQSARSNANPGVRVRLATIPVIVLLPLLVGAALAAEVRLAEPADSKHANVALGKPYVLNPSPNYPLTTDPGDSVQLTDGKSVGGGFWTEKGAVGWMYTHLVSITIDLGSPTSVSGAAFSTAAGRADVTWPVGIDLFCSSEGTTFSYLGDLVTLDRARGAILPANGFARHRFETRTLSARCRFVRFLVDTDGPYLFADELEVYGDPAGTAQAPMGGEPDGPTLNWKVHVTRRLRPTVEHTLKEATARLDASTIEAGVRAQVAVRLAQLEKRFATLSFQDWWSARDTYPVNDVHEGLFAVIGSLERLAGAASLRAWPANPWDPLSMTSAPDSTTPGAVNVSLMNGEVRAAAVNIRNSTGEPMQLGVNVFLGGARRPAWIEARVVAWTGDADGKPVAAALMNGKTGAGVTLTLPGGTTSQVWLSFAPLDLTVGIHDGMVLVSSPAGALVKVPIRLEVLEGRFPVRRRLHVGGWDYLNRNGVTPGTTDYFRQIAVTLSAYGVDLPWATSSAMPFGRYNEQGQMTEPPDTSVFDDWLALWQGAYHYRVFVLVGDRLAGFDLGTPAFRTAVKEWARFWSRHAMKLGVSPNQVDLLFVDEPNNQTAADRQIAWARALQDSGSGLQVWADPTYAEAKNTPKELVATADALCFSRALMEESGEPYRAFARRLKDEGKAVEVYGADGPTTKMDPYVYFRLQAWRAFDVGATAVSFWSFTDTGKGNSWREYAGPGTIYSPLFFDGKSVVPSKHLAAIREGAEDFEYLATMSDAIARESQQRRPDDPALVRARTVLGAAVRRVLVASRVENFSWYSAKDRSIADSARREIAEELRRLKATAPPPP
jgi:hypothetical protein